MRNFCLFSSIPLGMQYTKNQRYPFKRAFESLLFMNENLFFQSSSNSTGPTEVRWKNVSISFSFPRNCFLQPLPSGNNIIGIVSSFFSNWSFGHHQQQRIFLLHPSPWWAIQSLIYWSSCCVRPNCFSTTLYITKINTRTYK